MEQRRSLESESAVSISEVVYSYLYFYESDLDKDKNECLLFLDEHAYDLFANVDLVRSLYRATLVELISRDTFFAREVDIFNAVLQWHQGKRNVRLMDLLTTYIRWNLITPDEFEKYVRPSHFISERDYMKLRQIAHPNRIDHDMIDDNSSSCESCAESDTEYIKQEVIDVSEGEDYDFENEEQNATYSQDMRNDENDSPNSRNYYGDDENGSQNSAYERNVLTDQNNSSSSSRDGSNMEVYENESQNSTCSGNVPTDENDCPSSSEGCSNTDDDSVVDLVSDEDEYCDDDGDNSDSEGQSGNRVDNADYTESENYEVNTGDAKPHRCSQCTRRYRTMHQLGDHIRAHAVNFTCRVCGKRGFSLHSSIIKHKEEGRCDLKRIKDKYIERRQRIGSQFVSEFISRLPTVP